jgi:hypothetical protein
VKNEQARGRETEPCLEADVLAEQGVGLRQEIRWAPQRIHAKMGKMVRSEAEKGGKTARGVQSWESTRNRSKD